MVVTPKPSACSVWRLRRRTNSTDEHTFHVVLNLRSVQCSSCSCALSKTHILQCESLMEGPLMSCVSDLLQKPVEDLLMNQANRFRKTQEQRELISRGLPALHYGHVVINSSYFNVPYIRPSALWVFCSISGRACGYEIRLAANGIQFVIEIRSYSTF